MEVKETYLFVDFKVEGPPIPRLLRRITPFSFIDRLTVEAPVTVEPTVESFDDLLLLAQKFFHADTTSLKIGEEHNVSVAVGAVLSVKKTLLTLFSLVALPTVHLVPRSLRLPHSIFLPSYIITMRSDSYCTDMSKSRWTGCVMLSYNAGSRNLSFYFLTHL